MEGITYSEAFLGVDFDHSAEQVLAVRRNKVWNVEYSAFNFLQQLTQIVVVKW